MAVSGVAGYLWMEGVHRRRLERQDAVYQAAWEAGRRMTRRLTTAAAATTTATLSQPPAAVSVSLRNYH